MAYQLGFQQTDVLQTGIASGDTSMTLTTGSFGSPTGTQLLVIDYDVPAKKEVVSCSIAGTAVTSMTRGLDSTTGVAHSANANIIMAFVPHHYLNGLGIIAAGDGFTTYTPTVTQGATITKTTTYSKYRQLGTLVTWSFRLGLTSAGTAGQPIILTVPVAAPATTPSVVGMGGFSDASDGATGDYPLKVFFNSTTTIEFTDATQKATGVIFGAGVTIANGDSISGTITYEAATAAGA